MRKHCWTRWIFCTSLEGEQHVNQNIHVRRNHRLLMPAVASLVVGISLG